MLLPYHMQCAIFPMHFSCYIQRMFFSSYHIHDMFFFFNVLCTLFLTIYNVQFRLSTYNSCCFFPLIEGMLLSYNMQAMVFSFLYDIVCFIPMLFFCQINLLAIQIICGHKASPMLMLVIFNLDLALNICSRDGTVDRSHND